MFARFCRFMAPRKGQSVQQSPFHQKLLPNGNNSVMNAAARERKEVGTRWWVLEDDLGLFAFELALAIQNQLDEHFSGMLQCHGNAYELSQFDVFCFPALDVVDDA